MSEDTDRIPVPTNGRGPHPDAAPPPADESPGSAGKPLSRDQTVSFTPNQLAAGFGIIAGLLLLFVGARRRRGRPGRDE